jgi:uncharacterized membrane protein (DUF2068 family)
MSGPQEKPAARAPTLYGIIAIKLIKGGLFVALAVTAYTLSDNDLPVEFKKVMDFLGTTPANRFFGSLAEKVGHLTEAHLLWTAAGSFIYSLFSLVEGVGLIFRVKWCGWLAIGDSAFFIPLEVYELLGDFRPGIFLLFVVNVVIVWYLLQNRERLFKHH